MEKKKSKVLNVSLWVAQSILAIMLLMAGVMKFTTSIEDQRKMEWAKHISEGFIHFVAIAELLGAVGLLLPSILKIKPRLTVWAAIGAAIVFVSALILNISVGDMKPMGFLIVLTGLAMFIIWGRGIKAPIEPKN